MPLQVLCTVSKCMQGGLNTERQRDPYTTELAAEVHLSESNKQRALRPRKGNLQTSQGKMGQNLRATL